MTEEFGKLTINISGQLGREFVLSQPTTTVGSAETNDVVLKQAKVSRAHARIECSETGCTVFDLDSAKGTYVNNQRVQQANLASADIIKMGEAEVRFDSLLADTSSDATLVDEAIFVEETPASNGNGASGQADATDALVAIQADGDQLPFFCIVARHSDIALFGNLAQALGDDQPFYALQPPKSAEAEAARTNLTALVDHYLEQVTQVQKNGPYRLGGFNIGGLVALAMAHRLQELGHEVALLALIDTPYLAKNPLPYLSFRSVKAVDTLFQPLQSFMQSTFGEQIEKSGQAIRDAVYNQFPQVVDRVEEDIETFQESIIDDGYEVTLHVLKTYQPQPFLGKASLFLADESLVKYSGALWHWHRLIPDGLSVHTISGSYIGILKEPAIHKLASQLQSSLAEA